MMIGPTSQLAGLKPKGLYLQFLHWLMLRRGYPLTIFYGIYHPSTYEMEFQLFLVEQRRLQALRAPRQIRRNENP
ncbi:MAG: hypothetical protein ACE5OZ_17090 [Candidatus Heimdallarchaeota archaeon]